MSAIKDTRKVFASFGVSPRKGLILEIHFSNHVEFAKFVMLNDDHVTKHNLPGMPFALKTFGFADHYYYGLDILLSEKLLMTPEQALKTLWD